MTRYEHDKYYTEKRITTAFLEKYMPLSMPILISNTRLIFEPCSGLNTMAEAIQEYLTWANVVTNDLYPDPNIKYNTTLDAKLPDTYNAMAQEANMGINADWVITNPPYNDALDILMPAYEHVNIGVAMLLRLSFLEPTIQRAQWLNAHPPTALYILGSPRPSYGYGGSNDSVTTAWMVWDKSKLFRRGIKFLTNGSEKW